MGLIAKYRAFRKRQFERSLAKHHKVVKNAKAVREDRQAALEFFVAQSDAEVAVPRLLDRFSYSLDHGINDTREKELALEGIVKHGKQALPFVKEFLQSSIYIAWPIKILSQIVEPKEKAEILETCLDYGDVELDQKVVDKNYDILCYLMELELPFDASKLLKFAKVHDERVRFAAVEVLLKQKRDDINKELEGLLFDESSENIRLRQAVAVALAEQGKSLQKQEGITPGHLMPGFEIDAQFRVVSL